MTLMGPWRQTTDVCTAGLQPQHRAFHALHKEKSVRFSSFLLSYGLISFFSLFRDCSVSYLVNQSASQSGSQLLSYLLSQSVSY